MTMQYKLDGGCLSTLAATKEQVINSIKTGTFNHYQIKAREDDGCLGGVFTNSSDLDGKYYYNDGYRWVRNGIGGSDYMPQSASLWIFDGYVYTSRKQVTEAIEKHDGFTYSDFFRY